MDCKKSKNYFIDIGQVNGDKLCLIALFDLDQYLIVIHAL